MSTQTNKPTNDTNKQTTQTNKRHKQKKPPESAAASWRTHSPGDPLWGQRSEGLNERTNEQTNKQTNKQTAKQTNNHANKQARDSSSGAKGATRPGHAGLRRDAREGGACPPAPPCKWPCEARPARAQRAQPNHDGTPAQCARAAAAAKNARAQASTLAHETNTQQARADGHGHAHSRAQGLSTLRLEHPYNALKLLSSAQLVPLEYHEDRELAQQVSFHYQNLLALACKARLRVRACALARACVCAAQVCVHESVCV